MDYRSQEDHSMGIPTPASSSLAYNDDDDNNNNHPPCPNPIRVSAFSKPNSSSSPKDHHAPIRNGSSAHSHDHLGPLPSSDNSAAAADHHHHHHHHHHHPAADPVPLVAVGASATAPKSAISLTYRECLRNHAAAIGGHVLDGCCEFMPGDADPLKCAACDCHRSFHRKQTEVVGGGGLDSYYRHHQRDRISVPLLLPPPHPLTHTAPQHKHQNPCALMASPFGGGNNSGSGATTESSSEELVDHHAGGGPTPSASSKKRFRTKFTAEQKEKMTGFAERVGWRIQRQDDATVEEFCRELGIRRQVLRVWMHNNKHHSIKKQEASSTTTATAAAAAEHCVSSAISTATDEEIDDDERRNLATCNYKVLFAMVFFCPLSVVTSTSIFILLFDLDVFS